MLTSVARGIALFLGAFTLLNLAGDHRFAGESGNVWWIDLRPLSPALASTLLAAVAVALMAWSMAPPRFRLAAMAAVIVISIAAATNAYGYYLLLARGSIRSAFPVPLSLFILVAMSVIAFALTRAGNGGRARDVVFAAIICAVVFPLAQIATYGLTDYRRPADLIVVFGAKAFPDGTLSDALADRVVTGCELYRAGLAPHLLFSGGPNEPEAMQRFAMTLGVPATAIVKDPAGVNTEATARNTMALVPAARVLAVSHFYHLPRVKMTYQRYGANVFTVPSRDEAGGTAYNLVRETAAFWRYYLRRL